MKLTHSIRGRAKTLFRCSNVCIVYVMAYYMKRKVKAGHSITSKNNQPLPEYIHDR